MKTDIYNPLGHGEYFTKSSFNFYLFFYSLRMRNKIEAVESRHQAVFLQFFFYFIFSNKNLFCNSQHLSIDMCQTIEIYLYVLYSKLFLYFMLTEGRTETCIVRVIIVQT